MSTVLVVDDDEGVRQVIEDHLASSGYDVLTAPNTAVALRQLASHPEIDLCLVDLVMPSDVPDGVAFARLARSQSPSMPLILMTGYYSAAGRAGELAGDLVYKPVGLDKLEAEIRRLLGR
jgi:two-component system OmpR family response regulator